MKTFHSANKKSSILERLEPSFTFVDFIMMAFMSYQYFKLWMQPGIGDAEKIFQMAALMGFEFIMVHSGVFMAVMPRKLSLFLFVPAYGLFAWAFNSIIGGGNLVVYIYMFAVFNRMRFAFFNVDENLKNKQIGRSVFAAMTYFFLLFGVAFGSSVLPEFGLNDVNLTRIGYDQAKTHGGLFLDEPQTAICAGALYYLFLAMYALPGKWFWNEAKLNKWSADMETRMEKMKQKKDNN
ncbi:hypothetical protein [Moheibacter sediminis]|uniref:Uncharacterized protein n=1 Tax=Moheibacter sediminis TaxID=1434700 RepID=A0A1W2BRS2_9FLAO|nr:hypothetical protein [Moheibacter sediminis]SMC75653.1 hypothetical protein SAMN06296427_10784 [Moheibacter sediminis]